MAIATAQPAAASLAGTTRPPITSGFGPGEQEDHPDRGTQAADHAGRYEHVQQRDLGQVNRGREAIDTHEDGVEPRALLML